jgi:hypothetical protein
MRRITSRGSSSSLFPRSLAVRPSNLLPAAALFAILFFFFLERQSRLLQVRLDCVTAAQPPIRPRDPLTALRLTASAPRPFNPQAPRVPVACQDTRLTYTWLCH